MYGADGDVQMEGANQTGGVREQEKPKVASLAMGKCANAPISAGANVERTFVGSTYQENGKISRNLLYWTQILIITYYFTHAHKPYGRQLEAN